MYSRDQAKTRAQKLRAILKDLGHDISHAHALETIAKQNGYKDWNTCAAALDRRETLSPPPKGWQLSGSQAEHYDFGTDPSQTRNGVNPAVLRYKSNASSEASGFATMMQSFDAELYRGKRVQLSSEIKCEDNDGAVTLWMRADNVSGVHVAFDNLEERGVGAANGPITGTTDWSARTVVLDIPDTAVKMLVGFYIRGKGAAYCSGFVMNIVSDETPTTGASTGLRATPENMILAAK